MISSLGTRTKKSARKAIILALFLQGCQGGGEIPLPSNLTSPIPQAIQVTAPSASIHIGETVLFQAAVSDAAGKPISGAPVAWSSSDTNVATIDSNGVATGVGAGQTTITAFSGTISSAGFMLTVLSSPSTPPAAPPVSPPVPPDAPSGLSTAPGYGQITIRWSAVAGATSYNLYWANQSGVNKLNGTKIAGVTSPFTGLLSGGSYYFVITAANATGESAESLEIQVHCASSPPSWGPTTGLLNDPRSEHRATLLSDGRVLVSGGTQSSTGIHWHTAEVYDSATGQWSRAGTMTQAPDQHTATLLPSGKVLTAGGYNQTGSGSEAEIYDPPTNSWTQTASMSTPRNNHTATLLPNGKVLVVGGRDGPDWASAELYDPATMRWSPAAPMNIARSQHTATLLPNGKVLVAGGGNSLSSAEIYDPVQDTWSLTGSMTNGRNLHVATLLPDGRVLVAGGRSSGAPTNTSELYDPQTKSWSGAGSLTDPRSEPTALLLPEGRVLIVGGYGVNYLASAELYDPATGLWSPTAPLAQARYLHTMTLLPDGRILVAGGRTDAGSFNSSELYANSSCQ